MPYVTSIFSGKNGDLFRTKGASPLNCERMALGCSIPRFQEDFQLACHSRTGTGTGTDSGGTTNDLVPESRGGFLGTNASTALAMVIEKTPGLVGDKPLPTWIAGLTDR